jgi:hypothetical protein
MPEHGLRERIEELLREWFTGTEKEREKSIGERAIKGRLYE